MSSPTEAERELWRNDEHERVVCVLRGPPYYANMRVLPSFDIILNYSPWSHIAVWRLSDQKKIFSTGGMVVGISETHGLFFSGESGRLDARYLVSGEVSYTIHIDAKRMSVYDSAGCLVIVDKRDILNAFDLDDGHLLYKWVGVPDFTTLTLVKSRVFVFMDTSGKFIRANILLSGEVVFTPSSEAEFDFSAHDLHTIKHFSFGTSYSQPDQRTIFTTWCSLKKSGFVETHIAGVFPPGLTEAYIIPFLFCAGCYKTKKAYTGPKCLSIDF